MPHSELLLAVAVFASALLYSSVGHGGASAYLAAMALVGVAPSFMKPTALVLNILVSAIATVRFARAGYFSGRVFWPFASASVPLAYIGGAIALPADAYRRVVGAVLIYAAVRLFATAAGRQTPSAAPRLPIALAVGGAIGLLSGLTGVGGGIFLSPLLLLFGWAETREASGVAAAFILANSIAGLLGHSLHAADLPPSLPILAVAAVSGGWLGAAFGSRRLPIPALRRLLACVLLIGALKMLAG